MPRKAKTEGIDDILERGKRVMDDIRRAGAEPAAKAQESEVRSRESEAREQKPKTKAAKGEPAPDKRRVVFTGDPRAGQPPTGEVRIGMRLVKLPDVIEDVREGFDLDARDAAALVRAVPGFKYLEPKGAK